LAIIYILRTIVVVVYIAAWLALIAPALILYTVLVRSADLLYRVAMVSVRGAARLAGMHIRVEGVENVPPGVCVFVANHVSNVDPLAVVPVIPKRVALLAKSELFRIPILATAMRLASFVPVDRHDPEAAAASVGKALENLRCGVSFLVYPEGTRSPDGRLRPFKKGSFVLAIQAGVPVVPISIIGTQKVMRKGERFMRPGEVTIRFGPPVDASKYTMEQRVGLRGRVHDLVAAGLPEDQRPLPAARE
jgi:1-acyl-sn-glycerol-3-phosphate acyltransferase